MRDLPVTQLRGGDRVGQRAAGIEIGNQDALAGAQDGGCLGHEVHAAEDDRVCIGTRRLLRQTERVADVVGDVLNLGQLVVVSQDHRATGVRERAHLFPERGDVL